MFEAPCPYVPLSHYDWKFGSTDEGHGPPQGCPAFAWNPVVYSLFAGFEGCTICIAVYIFGQLFYTFKDKKKLYFWSILTTTWGTLILLAGVLITQARGRDLMSTIIMNVGWVPMVTGFSITLYSRLHLLDPSRCLLRMVLSFIILNGFVFHTPIIVLTILDEVNSSTIRIPSVFKVFAYLEVMFSIQEVALASLYIYLLIQFTKGSPRDRSTRTALALLIASEAFIVSTDVLLYVLLYLDFYLVRTMLQTSITIVKLQLEFVVLNWLLKFSQRHANHMELTAEYSDDATPYSSSSRARS